ncbi:MAG: hypothetical protein ABSF29_08555 [Tepidisphaeraceae bacterium]
MKYKRKITGRERWVLTVLPTVAILGIYLFWIYPGYSADLDKARQRLQAASGPAPRIVAPPSSAKAEVADLKRQITDRQTQIPRVRQRLASIHETQLKEEGDAARVIQKVEEACAGDGVTPLISEPIMDSASKGPDALISAMVLDSSSDIGDSRKGLRVWHYIFDDSIDKLQKAVQDMTTDNPTVVPLSLNLVYNPKNSGQTRLLELWLLY